MGCETNNASGDTAWSTARIKRLCSACYVDVHGSPPADDGSPGPKIIEDPSCIPDAEVDFAAQSFIQESSVGKEPLYCLVSDEEGGKQLKKAV